LVEEAQVVVEQVVAGRAGVGWGAWVEVGKVEEEGRVEVGEEVVGDGEEVREAGVVRVSEECRHQSRGRLCTG
jgi:hypothetical protein